MSDRYFIYPQFNGKDTPRPIFWKCWATFEDGSGQRCLETTFKIKIAKMVKVNKYEKLLIPEDNKDILLIHLWG